MHGDDEFGRTGAPPLNIAAVEKRDRIAAMDEIKRAIEVAEHAPFQFLVQHVGVGGESSSRQKIEAAMTSLEHLRAFAKPLGVQVVVENIPNDLSTPEGLVELLETAHFTDIGVCLDVGHAHMAPGVTPAFEALKSLIRTTHIHDNHGERDEHLWPGNGTISWKGTIDLLRSAQHVPVLMLEIEGVEGENVPQKMTESYKKLDV
jgi:sugar phosphate isomerase/epimerase